MISKYRPLTEYLSAAGGSGRHVVEMTFDEIAHLVGGLPPSVTQRQWWANTDHPRARAWLAANYRVEQVYLDRSRVRFALRNPTAVGTGAPTHPSAAPRPAPGRGDPTETWAPVDVRVVLHWRGAGTVILDGASMLSFPRLAAVPGLYRLSLPAATSAERRRIYVGEPATCTGA